MNDDNQLSALERLTKLRDTGALSEEEFAAQKATILGDVRSTEHVRFYRRLWVVVLLTCLIFTFPIAMIILLTGNVYRRKEGAFQPIGKTARLIYGGILALWIAALVVRAIIDPAGTKRDFTEGVTTSPATNTAPQTAANGPAPPDMCDSSDVADMVKGAIEDSATSKIIATKVLDFGRAHELFFDKQNNARYCGADAELNSGSTKLSYKLYFGPSGGELVEVKDGEDAFDTKSMMQAIAATAAQEIIKAQQQKSAAEPSADAQQQAPTVQDAQNSQANTGNGKDSDYILSRYSETYLNCMGSGEAAQGDSGGMIKCLDAEIDFQNTKYAAAYKAVFNSLASDKAGTFRSQEMAWADALKVTCHPGPDANGTIDPVFQPHCYLTNTVKHTIEIEKMLPR